MTEEKFKNSDVKMVGEAEGYTGPGFIATSLDKMVGMARANS